MALKIYAPDSKTMYLGCRVHLLLRTLVIYANISHNIQSHIPGT